MTRALAALFAGAMLTCPPAVAQSSPTLEHPEAFERSFATSLYMFDGCGDPLAGRMYRRALADKFAHCPFTPEARTRYQQSTRVQLARMRDKMNDLIERQGGLPVQLEGMPKTCHAQQSDESYRQYRDRLEHYAQGTLAAEGLITAPCDADDLEP